MMRIDPQEAFALYRPRFETPHEFEPEFGYVADHELYSGTMLVPVDEFITALNQRGGIHTAHYAEQVLVVVEVECSLEGTDPGQCDAMLITSAYPSGGFTLLRPFSRTVLTGDTCRVTWYQDGDPWEPVEKFFAVHADEPLVGALATLIQPEETHA